MGMFVILLLILGLSGTSLIGGSYLQKKYQILHKMSQKIFKDNVLQDQMLYRTFLNQLGKQDFDQEQTMRLYQQTIFNKLRDKDKQKIQTHFISLINLFNNQENLQFYQKKYGEINMAQKMLTIDILKSFNNMYLYQINSSEMPVVAYGIFDYLFFEHSQNEIQKGALYDKYHFYFYTTYINNVTSQPTIDLVISGISAISLTIMIYLYYMKKIDLADVGLPLLYSIIQLTMNNGDFFFLYPLQTQNAISYLQNIFFMCLSTYIMSISHVNYYLQIFINVFLILYIYFQPSQLYNQNVQTQMIIFYIMPFLQYLLIKKILKSEDQWVKVYQTILVLIFPLLFSMGNKKLNGLSFSSLYQPSNNIIINGIFDSNLDVYIKGLIPSCIIAIMYFSENYFYRYNREKGKQDYHNKKEHHHKKFHDKEKQTQ